MPPHRPLTEAHEAWIRHLVECDPCQAVALFLGAAGARCPSGEALRATAIELGKANAEAIARGKANAEAIERWRARRIAEEEES
jgi:hypothetical protein